MGWAGDRPVPPMVELARTAAPEFFADAILRLVHGGKIPPRDLQVELLEDAFAAASGAKEPIRLIGLPGIPPDTREIYRSKAGELGLDALSLQSRILREMVTLDRPKARAMFERIARPKLEPRPCAEALIADASPYYEAAALMAQSTFTDREKESELHVQFLSAVLAGARSPNELAAYAHALPSVALSNAQWRLLVAGIAAKLETIPADYRPFAMSLDAMQSELATLMDLARANQLGADELAQAFRQYLVHQLKAPRCGPDLALGLDQIGWLRPPLSEEETAPDKRNESYTIDRVYFANGDAKSIGDSLMRLRAANRPGAFSDFLRDFAAWQPDGSEIDVFHQKSTIVRALLEITRPGEDRDRALKLCIAFLQSSQAERANPAEWLWEAGAMADMAGADRPKLIAAFEASASVSLSLYAKLGYFGSSSGTSK